MIEGKSVPLTEARRVAASRIAAYDQAIAILGESPSGTMLRDGSQIWEQFADLLARLDKEGIGCTCGQCHDRAVDVARAVALQLTVRHAGDMAWVAREPALTEVIGMLRVDWDTLRRTLHAETEQLRGRGEKS